MSRALYALVACYCGKLHNVVPTSRRASKGSPTRMGVGPELGPSMLGEMPDNADRDGAAGVSRGRTRRPPGQGPSLPEPVAVRRRSPGSPADGAAVRARVVGSPSTGLGDPTTQARVPA